MQANRISRRTLLQAAGVSLALPMLEVMSPVKALASTAAKQPIRLAWIFFPNGTNADHWLPSADGDSWKVTPGLEPLANYKQHLTAFRGLAQMTGFALGDGPGDHARSSATFLTGVHPLKTASQIKVGRSIDQVLADSYGKATRLPSIELGTEEGRQAGDCDSGYSCAYSNNISWRSESQPMSKEVNPAAAFKRLFGVDDGKTGTIRRSVIDSVLTSQKRLMKHVSISDRQKLDQYFTSIREIEQRMDRLKTPVDFGSIEAKEPPAEFADGTEQIRLMYDLMVLAFRTDTTRLATYMLANEGSNRTFPMIDVKEGHHQLSHHQNEQDSIDKIRKIDRYYSEQFAYFLEQMKNTPDGESGTLLDNSLIVYGGSISDGNRHDHNDLPLVLAGHGGGRVTGGRFIETSQNTPLNNLFLTMADIAGSPVETHGDSTGQLALS
jgi:hypothetical protein